MIDEKKDWLSEEIKRERKISAWDLDEPYKVKSMHEKNCPKKRLAEEHKQVHESQFKDIDLQALFTKKQQYKSSKNRAVSKFFSTLIVLVFLLSILLSMFK